MARVKAAYPSCSPYLNLNNAALSPQPRIVEETVFRAHRFADHELGTAADIKGFKMHTPLDTPNLNAVTAFSIDGVSVESIEKRLAADYTIPGL